MTYNCRNCKNKKEGIVERLLELVNKPISLAKAIASGKDEVLGAIRLEVCLDCEALEKTKDGIYCSECGCPKTSLSELNNKTQYIDLECPKNKWRK